MKDCAKQQILLGKKKLIPPTHESYRIIAVNITLIEGLSKVNNTRRFNVSSVVRISVMFIKGMKTSSWCGAP